MCPNSKGVWGKLGLYVSGFENSRQETKEDQKIPLSAREFQILEYLISHEGEPVHRHDLLNEVWGYEAMPTTRTVDNFMVDIRKKLEEDPSNPRHFLSVRGIGYRFVSLKK
jgi:DNA-binding response OmpR family regulator